MDDMNEKNRPDALPVKLDDLSPNNEVNQGYQAGVFNEDREGTRIIKIFNNPNTVKDQKYAGSYEEARDLVALMVRYRKRLSEVGFQVPSPEEAGISVGELEASGTFVPVESVKNFGVDLQSLMEKADDNGKKQIVAAILVAAWPVLMADDLGADLKPANFVVSRDTPKEGRLLHIDPLPVLMLDEHTGLAITEWPPITAPEIQGFLRETHFTPRTAGYRFYQELCQSDPGKRHLFQDAIKEAFVGLRDEGIMDETIVQSITEAMEPRSSQILAQILDGQLSQDEGIPQIRQYIELLSKPGSHPIYALREMMFLISERLVNRSEDREGVTARALNVVGNKLGKDRRDQLTAILEKTPREFRLLTLIRKLTHLSNTNWRAGLDEEVALDVILNVSDYLIRKETTMIPDGVLEIR